MSTTPFFISAPRRRLGKGKPLPSLPQTVNQILGVEHGATAELIVVTVSGTVTGFTGMAEALAIGDGVEGHEPIEADFTNLPQVVFTFGADVSTMTEWLIPTPAAWEFANAEPLEEPHNGQIE